MKFTNTLWNSIEGIFDRILEHPFNRELMEGTLDKERFRFYIGQDALYLLEFGKALSLMGARCQDPDRLLDFVKFAEGGIVVERALHEHYFKEFGVKKPSDPSPTCTNYTNFLLASCSLEDNGVAMASLLPCFWIYKEVGDHIMNNAKENNPYQEWIDTYSSEDFAELVQKALDIMDEQAENYSQKGKEAMKKAFIRSSKFEWMFWDSAYQMEEWPV